MIKKIIETRQALITISALIMLSATSLLSANDNVESVTIIGSKEDAKNLAGSGTVINNEDLEKAMDTDIAKILSAVPGMYMRTEEGYGLRPNISIRGTAIERSGKVAIMEDGVLVAPSPYTSSAAYYFPTTGRIHSVEVLKGPSAVSQGPQTIGGAINLISTPIPELNSGKFVQELGENGMSRTHAYYGGTSGKLGALIEVHEHSSDGFDSIANVGGDTGFDKSDLMIKARYESGNHSLTFKMVDLDETSNQTYVGLSQASFNANPRMRYGATAYDEMMNDGEQSSLTYVGDFDNFDVVFTSWSNDYHRDWFKVSDFNNDSEHGERDDINELISDANNGSANAQAILDGELAVEIEYKHNNRYYTNEGYQFVISTDIGIHAIKLGYRDMEDSESRVQAYEYADQAADGSLSALYGYRGLGGSNNRLRESTATSYYLEDTMDFGRLNLTVGYRSEDYDQRHRRWDEGAGPNLTAVRNTIVRDTFAENDHTTSSFAATYDLNDNVMLVAGFHQGMTPMFGAEPEEADNTEIGLRFSEGTTNIEAFYFSSDYSNLAAECTLVSGASCDATESAVFSGGEADVSGLEFSGSWIIEGVGVTYPIALSYTSTDATFNNSSESDYFGLVAAGDDLPYIPSSSMSLVAGFISDSGLSGNLRLIDVGSSCSIAACGKFNKIDAHTILDANLKKSLNDSMDVYVIIENILDDENIISRAPSEGARSQKPRTMKVGFSYKF
ncbi:TonB-dependent receptor [Gammaproteobacteria bacterium]|jgi:Fe(3+) dicitrate transport protein|nr:TonB-dependent receptor [Gammaproteobacteria bacterium]|tara:strand:+ start:2512 stop:4701 length:2190 start_codon:yes stop_codon:yes gene_type:complete